MGKLLVDKSESLSLLESVRAQIFKYFYLEMSLQQVRSKTYLLAPESLTLPWPAVSHRAEISFHSLLYWLEKSLCDR